MRNLFVFLLVIVLFSVNAQDADNSFREDQLYFSVSYPFFSNPPNELIQNKLSYAISLGFIRDMPINTSRTLALGLGLGWSHATVFNNSQFVVADESVSATIAQQDSQQNQLSMQSLVVPFEVRWRNATASKHAFWRIHSGISLHVPMKLASFYSSGSTKDRVVIPSKDVLLSWHLNFGFNTWNISVLHDLQPWATATTANGIFDIKFTRIGLIFYIF